MTSCAEYQKRHWLIERSDWYLYRFNQKVWPFFNWFFFTIYKKHMKFDAWYYDGYHKERFWLPKFVKRFLSGIKEFMWSYCCGHGWGFSLEMARIHWRI